MGVVMAKTDLTAMASAVGVLEREFHRPPMEHISPAAAALQDDTADEPFSPTWRDAALAAAGLVVFWVFYVCTWALFGGAA